MTTPPSTFTTIEAMLACIGGIFLVVLITHGIISSIDALRRSIQSKKFRDNNLKRWWVQYPPSIKWVEQSDEFAGRATSEKKPVRYASRNEMNKENP